MDPWVYPRERSLGTITLVLGLLVWALLVLGTLGIALIYVLFGFIAMCLRSRPSLPGSRARP